MGHRHLFVLSLGLLLPLLLIATAHAGGGHARGAGAAITLQGNMEDGVGSMMRSMVGSRPPSCAGRCWWCGARRCEAVQVPITPQEQDKSRRHGHGSGEGSGSSRLSAREGGGVASAAAARQHHQQRRRPSTSSYDDHSNYKPLSWRCKCGGG